MRAHFCQDASCWFGEVSCAGLQKRCSIIIFSIDAEGYDARIVEGILGDGIPSKVIQFESYSLTRKEHPVLIRALVDAGFVTARSGFDTIAVHD